MAENTGKTWRKLKEGSKGSTTVGKTLRNTQLARICFDYKQIWLFATKGTCQFQFRELFQFATPQIDHIADKNGFIDSKNPVSILSLNQGNHNMGNKCPDYGQRVTINMYDQTMISLESCSMYYDRV